MKRNINGIIISDNITKGYLDRLNRLDRDNSNKWVIPLVSELDDTIIRLQKELKDSQTKLQVIQDTLGIEYIDSETYND